MKKRFLAVLLVLIMAISVLPFSAAAATGDAQCADGHNWKTYGTGKYKITICTDCANYKLGLCALGHTLRSLEKTETVESTCEVKGIVRTYKICAVCNSAVLQNTEELELADHSWTVKAADKSTCGVCGAECEHENWTGNVCDECEFECASHNWDVDTCTICGTECEDHTWNKDIEKSECDICDAECLHTYENSNTCAVCEYVCTHATDAGEQTETTDATCTTAGNVKKFKVCKHCEMEYDVVNEAIPAGHTWVDGKCQKCPAKCRRHIPTSLFPAKKTVEPTCTEAGYSVYFYDCKTCGFDSEFGQKFDFVKATGHTWVSDAEGGECSVCGETHAHEFDEGTTVTEATCTVDGEGVKTCQVDGCDYDETYVITKTGHTWTDVRVGRLTYSKCQKCGAICSKHTIGEDGKCTICGKGCTHQPEGNKVQMRYVPATCTEKGYYEWYKICKHCGVKYDVTKVNGHAPATGHKWIDAQDGDSRVCRVEGCDAKCELHVWRHGVCATCGKRCGHPEAMQTETVTKEATCEETGIKTITCACGVVVGTEEIPMAEHDFQDGVCDECGETEGCDHPAHKRREITTQRATCTRKGNVAVICGECRETIENREIAMLDHYYGWNNKCVWCWADKPVEEDPNGDEGQNGNDDDNNVTPPEEEVDCAHENTTVFEKDATCSEDGHIVETCNDCGATISREVLTAPGHSMKVVQGECVEATCKAPGKIVRACETCGHKETESVAQKIHEYVNDYCAGCGTADPKDYTVDFFGLHIVGNTGK